MSIGFQIRSSVFAEIITRAVQQQLRKSCFPETAGSFVDHLNVSPTASPRFSAAGGAVEIRVPVDVFVVRRDAVLAAPNGVPDGATNPLTSVDIILVMKTDGTVVSLSSGSVQLGPLGSISFGEPVVFDLAPIFEKLSIPPPASSSVELAGDIVCVQFDAAGAAVDHLFADHEWGLFIDGAAVESLVRSSVSPNLPSAITSLQRTPHWRPNGLTPHVDIDYEGAAKVPDPFSARVRGTFSTDISLIPTPAQLLRNNVSWTLNVDLGTFVPAFVDKIVKDLIAAAVDPTKFGGTPTGPRSFIIEKRLPDFAISGSRLMYSSVQATPAGMTIGGAVRLIQDPGRETLKTSITTFTVPHYVMYASHYGCVFGWQGEVPSGDEFRVSASVSLDSSGEFCAFELISADSWVANYTAHHPDFLESRSVRISLPALNAAGITEPVRILVRTSRGVRLIDFGKPRVEIDENGKIVNAEITPIDDCLYMTIYDWYWATLPTDPITGRPLPPPPKPWPPPDWNESNPEWLTSPPEADVWNSYIETLNALNVQIVTVTGLEPGELIQFRSFEHSVDVTADKQGRAVVPVVLSVRYRLEPAKLTRVSRQNFNGAVTVRSAVLTRHVQLEAGQNNRVATGADGTTYVLAESADETVAYRPGALGTWSRLGASEIPELRFAAPSLIEESVRLPGLVSLIRLPGFQDESIALAIMDDDSTLVLDLADKGNMRVAGTFMGPIGAITEIGEWGIAAAPNRITAFKVSRSANFVGPSQSNAVA
jgi:hypothetical protein